MSKKKSNAAADIAAAMAVAKSPPPDVRGPVEDRPFIEENDAEGRQAGDPDGFIELPLEILAPELTQTTFKTFTSGSELTHEELAKLTPAAPERRPGVVTDKLPQPPVLSEKTRLEMEAGRGKLTEFAQLNPHRVNEPPRVVPATRTAAVKTGTEQTPSRPPVMTAATLAELAAGKEALARKAAEYARNVEVSKRAMAKAAGVAAADTGDLDYTKNRN
jgi:hypothetical protein